VNIFLKQLATVISHTLKVESKNFDRLLSSFLFAVTVMVLFFFALGEINDITLVKKVFIAETYLAAFLALQISFSRSFELDLQDKVFELLRTYPLSPYVWFLAKMVTVFLMGVLILVPTIGVSLLFHKDVLLQGQGLQFFAVALLSLLGLCALGVLLSSLMIGHQSQQILYPILYFPLTTPVLLSASQASESILSDGSTLGSMLDSWLGLLLIFIGLYFFLGLILFKELVKAEN
jgi:heme exporter protein B